MDTNAAVRRAIGLRLRRWRLSHGHSQRALADLIGVTQATVSNYETGRRDIPFAVAAAMASQFNASLDDLARVAFAGATAEQSSRDDVARVISVLAERPELASVVASVCEIIDVDARPAPPPATETSRPRISRRAPRQRGRYQQTVA